MEVRTQATVEDLYNFPDEGKIELVLSQDIIKVYRASDPDIPTIYRRGQMAEAEPAVPGWEFQVDYRVPPDYA